LEWALEDDRHDPVAAYALGNYYYDHKRHADAIRVWKRAVADGAEFATVFRNLGIATWNVHRDGEAARAYYLRALELDSADPRLVSEFDQLRAKLNDPLADRLEFLNQHPELVFQRDDCTVALATLHNLSGDPARALEILTSRRFHPWEGGEGSVLRQFTTAHLLLGRAALDSGAPQIALTHFNAAMETPASLGEAYHLLQAKADVNYWIGMAMKALVRNEQAAEFFIACANEAGDFSNMAVIEHSPLSYYRGLALVELDRDEEAAALFKSLKAFANAELCRICLCLKRIFRPRGTRKIICSSPWRVTDSVKSMKRSQPWPKLLHSP
jgi:tetratricopeptide (TPR) repeat protein